MRARAVEEWAVFLLAVQFLTRLPVPADAGFSPERLAATPRWYPAVGVLVGAVAALAFWIAATVYPPALAAVAATAVGVLVTGCFHEDGFADACDGLGGGADRAAALEIMRDSRLGTYGAVALGLVLAGKVLALAAMPVTLVPAALIGGHAASRASSVVVVATGRYVREHGTGKPVAGGLGAPGLGFALATAAAALVPLGLQAPSLAIVGGLVGLGAGHAAMRRAFGRKLGGYTGDCLGAVQQTSEVGFLLGILACL